MNWDHARDFYPHWQAGHEMQIPHTNVHWLVLVSLKGNWSPYCDPNWLVTPTDVTMAINRSRKKTAHTVGLHFTGGLKWGHKDAKMVKGIVCLVCQFDFWTFSGLVCILQKFGWKQTDCTRQVKFSPMDLSFSGRGKNIRNLIIIGRKRHRRVNILFI